MSGVAYKAAGAVLLSILAVGAAMAQQNQKKPQEFRISQPLWVMAGQTAVVKLIGQDLNPTGIRFENPGFRAGTLKADNFNPEKQEEKKYGNRVVEVEVSVPADARPGYHRFVLSGPEVQDAEGELLVDVPAPEMEEKEPNNTLAQPHGLPAGSVTVRGVLNNEGADVYQFEGKAGETWRVEIFGRRLNPSIAFEPVLRLRDPRRAPVRVAVDQGTDCFLEYRIQRDGPHLIEVFDGDTRASNDMVYRLLLRRVEPR